MKQLILLETKTEKDMKEVMEMVTSICDVTVKVIQQPPKKCHIVLNRAKRFQCKSCSIKKRCGHYIRNKFIDDLLSKWFNNDN